MILKALMDLAERDGLMGDLDYQPLPVRWILTINSEGELLGDFVDTLQRRGDERSRPVAAIKDIPKRGNRTVQSETEFVVDKPEYVLGWFNEAELRKANPANLTQRIETLQQRAAKRRALYRAEVELAAERTKDEGLSSLAKFLARPTPALPDDLGEGDLIAFRFAGDDEARLITDREDVRAYWSRRRREPERGTGRAGEERSDSPAEETLPCLVTGRLLPPVALHPKIKGIPPRGETKGGVQLTSVNAPAFESYRLDEIGCAPVSRQAADAYEKALNKLLGDPLRHATLSHSAVVVFWSKGDGGAVDLFADAVIAGDPDSIRALYDSAWKGRPIHLDDLSPFYALTLSGAIGRGTVRNWQESTLGAALTNLRGYFDDLKIVRPAQDEGRPRPLLGLLRQLAVQGDLDNIHPNMVSELFGAILGGRPFPRAVLDAAVRRIRSERTIYADRAALLKAYLCRARKAGHFPDNFPEIKPMLDEECPAPAYRLGRLFAVLEKVQEDAVGASATIRDRYYGAASATPVVVFPQLLRKAPHHLAKLGNAVFYEKLIQQICDGLLPPTPFPHALALEGQGLFAVGYYHQRQSLFTSRKKQDSESTGSTIE